jgi:transposase InsO family protein
VDLVGPLPVAADGSTYLLTIIDRTTRWLEAVPLRSMEAGACAEAVIQTWITRYGVPSNITTDRGRQFMSALWGALCNRLGISHITTTAYHPQANGMVERSHRQIKDALRARLAGPDWPLHLP